jgi:hypothetical protein
MPVMEIAGIVILIVAGACFLFMAVDRLGLARQQGSGTVLGREHRDAVMGQRMDIINQRAMVVPHATPEKYVLKLELEGRQTEGTVSRIFFEEVQPGDRVWVTFQKRRLTGLLQVLQVSR